MKKKRTFQRRKETQPETQVGREATRRPIKEEWVAKKKGKGGKKGQQKGMARLHLHSAT